MEPDPVVLCIVCGRWNQTGFSRCIRRGRWNQILLAYASYEADGTKPVSADASDEVDGTRPVPKILCTTVRVLNEVDYKSFFILFAKEWSIRLHDTVAGLRLECRFASDIIFDTARPFFKTECVLGDQKDNLEEYQTIPKIVV